MAITRATVDSVLKWLQDFRGQLLLDLADVDRTIACVERMYRMTPEARVKEFLETEAETVKEFQRVEAVAEPEVDPTVEEIEAKSEGVEIKPGRRAVVLGIGLTDAIKKAAEEAKFNQTEISKRVVELRPGTAITTAVTQVSSMLKMKLLHKGPDLIIRNVVDGKIQGLPVREGEGDIYGPYNQSRQ